MAVSTVVSVVLEEADIPGASLDEHLDSHNMACGYNVMALNL